MTTSKVLFVLPLKKLYVQRTTSLTLWLTLCSISKSASIDLLCTRSTSYRWPVNIRHGHLWLTKCILGWLSRGNSDLHLNKLQPNFCRWNQTRKLPFHYGTGSFPKGGANFNTPYSVQALRTLNGVLRTTWNLKDQHPAFRVLRVIAPYTHPHYSVDISSLSLFIPLFHVRSKLFPWVMSGHSRVDRTKLLSRAALFFQGFSTLIHRTVL